MSDGNRLRNYALGLLAGLAAAFLVGHFVLWQPAIQSEENAQLRAAKQAEQYENGTYISVECVAAAIAGPRQPECMDAEREAAHEAQRNEYDLEAQQIMAVWTRTMGKAAIIGMGVGLVGLILIFTTFWETRKAASASQKTYEAFVAAEDASLIVEFPTGDMIEHFVEGVKQPDTYFLVPVITNIGRSAARIQGWTVNDEKFQRREYTLKAGDSWTVRGKIDFTTEDGTFKMSLHYSSPLADGRILDVTGKVRAKRQANGGTAYSGRVMGTNVRET